MQTAAYLDVVEQDPIPAFYGRGDVGVPRRWVTMVKRSARTIGRRVVAMRMLRDYIDGICAVRPTITVVDVRLTSGSELGPNARPFRARGAAPSPRARGR